MTKIKKTMEQEGQPVEYLEKVFRKAGIILLVVDSDNTWIAVVTSQNGVLSFPKGGIEKVDKVKNSPWATLRNAGFREGKEETGVVLETNSYQLFDELILEINENNPTGKRWNIAYSVCFVREKVPLCGEEGKGTVAWLPVNKVLEKLELAGARSRRQALKDALAFFNHANAY